MSQDNSLKILQDNSLVILVGLIVILIFFVMNTEKFKSTSKTATPSIPYGTTGYNWSISSGSCKKSTCYSNSVRETPGAFYGSYCTCN